MDFSFKGKVVQVLPKTSGVSQTGNPWSKQTFIVEHEHGQYPKTIAIDVMGDKIEKFNIQQDEWLTFHLDVSCREYNGKFYNTIQAWKVEREEQTDTAQTAAPAQAATTQFGPTEGTVQAGQGQATGGNGDLPF